MQVLKFFARRSPQAVPSAGPKRRRSRKKGGLVFNRAIIPEKQAIYIAVPKTGSTAIRKSFQRRYEYMITASHLNIQQIRAGLYVQCLKASLRQNNSFPTDCDEAKDNAEIEAEAERIYADYFKFSMVRNPWARVASMYTRREGLTISQDMSFEQFCLNVRYSSDTCRMPSRHSNQLDWLLDRDGKMAMDYVARLETLAEDAAAISRLTDGRVQIQTERRNANPSSFASSYRDAYSDAARKHIGQVFERDIEYFEYRF